MTTTERAMIADELAEALKNCLRVIDYDGALDADPQRTSMDGHAALSRYEASKQSEKPDTAQDVVTDAMVEVALRTAYTHKGMMVGAAGAVMHEHMREVLEAVAPMLAAAPAQPQAEVPGWAWKQAINNPDRDSESGDLLNDADSIESRAREIAAAQARGEGK